MKSSPSGGRRPLARRLLIGDGRKAARRERPGQGHRAVTGSTLPQGRSKTRSRLPQDPVWRVKTSPQKPGWLALYGALQRPPSDCLQIGREGRPKRPGPSHNRKSGAEFLQSCLWLWIDCHLTRSHFKGKYPIEQLLHSSLLLSLAFSNHPKLDFKNLKGIWRNEGLRFNELSRLMAIGSELGPGVPSDPLVCWELKKNSGSAGLKTYLDTAPLPIPNFSALGERLSNSWHFFSQPKHLVEHYSTTPYL